MGNIWIWVVFVIGINELEFRSLERCSDARKLEMADIITGNLPWSPKLRQTFS